MGIPAPLDLYEYAYNRWDRMAEYGMNDSPPRQFFHRSVLWANEILGFFTCRPWVAFLVSILMVAAEYIRKSPKRGLYALLLGTAIFSYGAHLVFIFVFQQRMFYPALILLMTMDASITLDWIGHAVSRIRKPSVH